MKLDMSNFFFRRLLPIPNAAGGKAISLEPNAGNRYGIPILPPLFALSTACQEDYKARLCLLTRRHSWCTLDRRRLTRRNDMAGSSSENRMPAHFRELVERVEEAAADPVYAQRKLMYTRHNRLEKVEKVPVGVHLHRGYRLVWQELIPPETIISHDPLERDIELQLRQKLYRHDHIPDDEVLLPTVWIDPVRPNASVDGGDAAAAAGTVLDPASESPAEIDDSLRALKEQGSRIERGVQAYGALSKGDARLWGLPFQVKQTGHNGGAYKVEPVVTTETDMGRLHHPKYEVDERETRLLLERATEIVDGRLPVKLTTDELGASPSETVVSLMGIEALYYLVIDKPDFIHRMMDFVTEGYIAYHRSREAAGAVDAESTWGFRTHFEELPPGAGGDRLTSCWWYISAQSFAGLSPAMYADFLQPYHERLAAALADGRVYYHGCEDLSAKIPIIKRLPHLRRFHVSAWTDLETAVEQLGREFVLEVHMAYGDVLYSTGDEQIRKKLEHIMKIAGDCIIDINLGDIETVKGSPDILANWARIAQEVTAR